MKRTSANNGSPRREPRGGGVRGHDGGGKGWISG